MLWVRFDVDDRMSPTPDFCLADATGNQVCLRTYLSNCNLVLFFASEFQNPEEIKVLQALARRSSEYRAEDANILGVIPSLPTDPQVRSIISSFPFPVLIDPGSKVRKTYAMLMDRSLTTPPEAITFILDRFSAPYIAAVGIDDVNALQEGAIDWLRYIDIQCPE